jgi:hypothetical protein
MKAIIVAHKFISKLAAKLSKEEAAKALGVSLTDRPEDITKIFEDKLQLLELDKEDRTDDIIDLEAAFRTLMGITDPNLDNYGKKIVDEAPVSEEEFDELDKQLGDFSTQMWGMDLDAVEKKYQDLDQSVQKLTNK